MNSPKISVILPVYNAEDFVGEAIQSILDQSYVNFEFLIFNDASTDRSLEIIESFNDPRIKLINSSENKGYLLHLNEGLKLAKGKYIARMDADDISFKDRFKKQIEFLEEFPNVGVVGTAIKMIGDKEDTKVLPLSHDEIKKELLLRCPLVHPTVMIRKSILEKFNLSYDANYYTAEDYHLWTRLSELTELANLDEFLLYYRWHENNISVKKNEFQKSKKEKIQIIALNNYMSGMKISKNEEKIHLGFLYAYKRQKINWKSIYNWICKIEGLDSVKANDLKSIYGRNILLLAAVNTKDSFHYFPYGFRLLSMLSNASFVKIIKISIMILFKKSPKH